MYKSHLTGVAKKKKVKVKRQRLVFVNRSYIRDLRMTLNVKSNYKYQSQA